ncbi:hypothetical protein Nepgr_026703 [Nepenthes gracilis]|uniref:Uncharacterized protein n=1 Tax=Nepenthes gracilis TaxID=150966 RepID=A0AAD3T7D4_NEPGR|nr:hypothetical protein Nepgr_026703 [Nepenthes gracilis]
MALRVSSFSALFNRTVGADLLKPNPLSLHSFHGARICIGNLNRSTISILNYFLCLEPDKGKPMGMLSALRFR